MAKGIDINGQLRGKRGGIVYYRANGAQISRVKAENVKNPRSAKQAVQRMVLAAASKLTAALRPIVDHSFEGTAVGEPSVRLFRSRAMKYLRAAAAQYFNDPTALQIPADFPLKGAPIVGGAPGLYISQGTLGLNGVTIDTANDALVMQLSSALSESISTQAEYITELRKLGIQPGDQLTFVVLAVDNTKVVASFDYGSETPETDFAQIVRFSRVVFAPELPENFSGALIVNAEINPALVAESLGQLPSLTTSGTTLSFGFQGGLEAGYRTYLGTIIRSQRDGNKFRYSSAALLGDNDALDENDAYPTYLSYMDGASSVNVGDELYLRHAEAAPFAQGE